MKTFLLMMPLCIRSLISYITKAKQNITIYVSRFAEESTYAHV